VTHATPALSGAGGFVPTCAVEDVGILVLSLLEHRYAPSVPRNRCCVRIRIKPRVVCVCVCWVQPAEGAQKFSLCAVDGGRHLALSDGVQVALWTVQLPEGPDGARPIEPLPSYPSIHGGGGDGGKVRGCLLIPNISPGPNPNPRRQKRRTHARA